MFILPSQVSTRQKTPSITTACEAGQKQYCKYHYISSSALCVFTQIISFNPDSCSVLQLGKLMLQTLPKVVQVERGQLTAGSLISLAPKLSGKHVLGICQTSRVLVPGVKIIIPRELEISLVRSISMKMFTVAVFIAAKTWRKSNAITVVDGIICKH